jgi:hypothetical protein
MYIGTRVQYPLFLSDFNKTWLVLKNFPWILKYEISRKSVQWEPSCSIRTCRYDDANSRFSKFWKGVKTSSSYLTKNQLHLYCGHKADDLSRIYRSSVLKITQNIHKDRVRKCVVSESNSKWYMHLPLHFKLTNQLHREIYYSIDQCQNLSL